MNLRKKSLLFNIILFCCLVLIVFAVLRATLLSGFSAVEKDDIFRKVMAAASALNDNIKKAEMNALDYSSWDATYRFVNDEYPDFLSVDMSESFFANLDFDFITIINVSGEKKHIAAYDIQNAKPAEFPAGMIDVIEQNGEFFQSPQSGIVVIPEGPVVFSSQQILKSDGSGPSRGSLIVGRILDERRIEGINEVTGLKIHALDFKGDYFKTEQNKGIRQTLILMDKAEQIVDNNTIKGYKLVYDVFNQPLLTLAVESDRQIYKSGTILMRNVMVALILIIIVFVFFIFIFNERNILRRLFNLTREVNSIGENNDAFSALEERGNDEISKLAGNINGMAKKLFDNEKRFRDIIENVSEWIWEIDAAGKIRYTSQNVEKIFNLKPENIVEKNIESIITPELTHSNKSGIASILRDEKAFQGFVGKLTGENNQVFWLSSSGNPIYDENKNFQGFRGVSMDITELINFEKASIKQASELSEQRLAILNILEDVTNSQENLKKTNEMLDERSKGLKALKEFGDKQMTAASIKDVVEISAGYIDSFFEFSVANFLIFNPDDEGSLNFTSYLKEEVSESFIDDAKFMLMDHLSRDKSGAYASVLKVLKLIKPKCIGKELDNKNKSQALSSDFYYLSMEEKQLGIIQIISVKASKSSEEETNFMKAITATITFAIDRLQTLSLVQHFKTKSLVESLSDGVVMFGVNKEIELINPSFYSIIGKKEKLSHLRDLFNIMPSIDLDSIINKTIKSGKSFYIKETVFEKRYYEVYVTAVKDNKEKIIGGAIVLHDITYLKEMDQLKTEFVSVASHQLRTPLTAIKLFSDMLYRGDVGDLNLTQKDYIGNVKESTDRMVKLVNDLLNVTRIESGRLRIEAEPIDVVDYIKGIIAEDKPSATSKKQTIKFKNNAGDLPKIPLDKTLFRQVVQNLLTNAIRYSKSVKGEINVILDKKDEKNIVITVSDNGIGIPKEASKRLFEKFYRTDNAIKAVTEGTGLGLYVCKMIVDSSGGKIWFDSEVNKGSNFYVEFPLKGMKSKEGERGMIIS